ncbi:hypothetical protein lerEdw1_005396 [Lerista edwardsae]|nr:hypothetical protein lerEdw1_005396 [Lerista edwardsae]
MGTVPDPLRSAKLLLVAASEEENGLREPQPPTCLHKPASIERSSNGLSCAAKMQPAGDCLLEVNCAPKADVPRGEQHCRHDTNQPSMFSPGPFSPSKDGCLVASELVNNSEQEGSHDSAPRSAAESCISAHAADKVAAAQEASTTVQTDAGGQLCHAVDQASSPSGEGDRSKESQLHDCPPLPAHSNALPAAPQAGGTVSDMTPPEKTSAPASATESEAASDREATKDAGSQPSARTVPETVPRPALESTSQPPCKEAAEKPAPEPSRFKDTGTMTVQPDDKPGGGEVMSRTQQDAEVQAVASVESKSASTSPSIFATFLRENMPSKARQKQEQLHIIYTGAGGKEQSEIVDRFVPLVQTAPSTGIIPEVRIQAAAAGDLLETQAGKRQERPAGTHDAVRLALSDDTKRPSPPASDSTPEVNRLEAQITSEAVNLSAISQQLPDSSILLKTKPVYQITVNPSNLPVAAPQPVNAETKLPPSAALPESNSKPQHLGPSASSSCHRTSEQATTSVGAHGSNQGEQLQNKTVNGLESGPVNVQVDEGKFVPPKPQETSNLGAAAGPLTTCTPVTAKREQDMLPKDNKEAKASGGRNLAAGAESELRRDSIRSLGTTKSSETRKGGKPGLPAASAQPVSNLGEKKKERKSAAEVKVQLKQSKRIRDVVWDEQGMTWEVYGASLDPESLGIAIQNHLQRQIREHEKLIKAQNPQNRKSISSDTSSNKKLKGRQHGVFQSMLQNFRRPNCCVRPAASSVLD